VNAIAQNLVGPLNRRILKLLWFKHRLHLSKSLKSHHPGRGKPRPQNRCCQGSNYCRPAAH
jgi:hypothetical protein